MNAQPGMHPTDQNLHSYGLGKLEDAMAESVNAHLEGCPDCRQRIAALSSDSFLGRLRDAGIKPGAPVSAPVVSSLAGLSMIETGPGAAAPPPANTLPPGLAEHPDYDVIRELGQGGMGTVYLARNRLMGRYEVLKVVSSHLMNRRGVLDRFLIEIRNAARLQHPNIVTAYSASRLGESIVLAMEYVDGLDLAKLVKARGSLPVANACNYAHQAALGLQHAHEQGMVHRDIKPSNLMLAKQGNRAVIKVLDFGLAKVKSERGVDGGLTHEGQMLGTPDFIAPEQIGDARLADVRADIYSLGCTLYYLLTGAPPFTATSLYEILQAHHSMDALPLNLARPEVPVELAALVARMMAKEPERRFQEPRDVAQALVPFFKKSPSSVGSRPEISHVSQTSADRPVLVANQPAKDARSTAVSSEKVRGPASADTGWQSLIQIRDEEPPIDLAPANYPAKRPPWKRWPIAIAASAFGLIALGVIIITIFDKDGHEVGKVTAIDGSRVVVEGPAKEIEVKPSGTTRDDAAGGGGPVAAAAESEGRPASKPTATTTDPFQPGTLWSGTSTVVLSSRTNERARPREIRLRIKTRTNTHFKAVAESHRGVHDAEGTLKDGMIDWTVVGEEFAWHGKLDGRQLVGEFRGSDSLEDLSGEFRLTLVANVPTYNSRQRVPPVGPARSAVYVKGGEWIIDGDELVKADLGNGSIAFGDDTWVDYDFAFEARKSAGPHGFGGCFRQSDGKSYLVQIGGPNSNHYIDRWVFDRNGGARRDGWIGQLPGTIEAQKWYSVKVSIRGERLRIEVDGTVLHSWEDAFNGRGHVSLRFFNGAGRFRRIKVTAPDGTVLWEGPPDLP